MDSERLQLLLSDLPVEILEHIFAFLPLVDRKAASLVCRSWNELAFNRRQMRTIALNLLMDWEQSQLDYLRRSSRHYRNVFAFFGPETACEHDFGLIIEVLNLFGTNLDSFHCISNLTEHQLWLVITRAPKLKQLIVGLDTTATSATKIIFPTMDYLMDLGSLINVLQIESLDTPNLTQLSANFTDSTDAKESFATLQKLGPQLKILDLFSTEYFIPIEELQFPRVEALMLAGKICDARDDVARTFFENFKCLKQVTLDFNVTELVLDVLTKTCPAIENLHFKSDLLSSNAFKLLERLKGLKSLSIIGIINFRIALHTKPMVSVKHFSLQMSNVDDEETVIADFRMLLPNVDDMTLTFARYCNTMRQLIPVCLKFSHLKRFTVSDADTEYHMQGCRHFIALRYLSQLEELTLKSINTPIESMGPNRYLKRLKIMYMHWLTNEDLLLLAALFPNLRYFELAWCRKVTPSGIEMLRLRLTDCEVRSIE